MTRVASLRRKEPQAERAPVTVNCNCADVPPTMPTCRTEHLPTCPVAWYVLFHSDEARVRHEEIRQAFLARRTSC